MAARFRRPVAVAALLLAAYAALCLLVFLMQRDLVYLAGHTRVAVRDTDFALPREAGVVLRGWLAAGDQPDALLYFGGNAEQVGHLRDRAGMLFPGHAVYLLAYRGYGASDGRPTEADLGADAVALYDHVRASRPGARIRVVGRSLGSGVAAALASRRPVDRLVLVTPFDDMAALASHHHPWLPVGLLLRERYPAQAHLAGHDGPVLVVRAGRDRVVPPERTDALIAALPSPPLVLELPFAGHDFALDEDAVVGALRAFLHD
ncbi:MAG: alpha/beta hydrolase [Pseudoxanthomonas sp.]|nr:alpha/beta hydrolase [Pseudoxanthomonas sp.]